MSDLLTNTNIRDFDGLPSRLEMIDASFPDRPAAGPALARLLLDQVAAGERPPTVRISRPGRVIAFGRRDTTSPGYPAAIEAMREAGFKGMERLTGGRVAAHAEGTMVLSLTTPESHPAAGTEARFRFGTELVRDALRDLGVDARVGPVPGEYCPGSWSVNGAGRIKLAGVGQRMIRGGAYLGFVIVASDSAVIREALIPIHDALGLDWDPATAGAADDLNPGVTLDQVEAALIARLELISELSQIGLDAESRDRALARADRYHPPDTVSP